MAKREKIVVNDADVDQAVATIIVEAEGELGVTA